MLKRHAKRVLVDAAGYLLILAAILLGWLPGPGGIPLAIAGLGLLSINNQWARRLRKSLLANGGKLIKVMFPDNTLIQWLYDIIVILLWIMVALLAWRHSAIWQISLAIGLFFLSLFVAMTNRDRLLRIRGKKD